MAQPRSELVFLPLGGVGEIGMNMALYGVGPEDDRHWLMVDCGVSFGDANMPGVDLIMADPRFIEEERHALAGIVITHAHEDHFGALIDLWPRLEAPVYMTPFAAQLLEAKRQSEPNAPRIKVVTMKPGRRMGIGPFDVEVVAMSHSIPEPVALFIRTDAGNVLHTGDWKIDPTPMVSEPIDLKRLAEIGDEGVDVMVCDSTNALREGRSPSELDVSIGLQEVIMAAEKRVAVTAFSSNVARIRSIALAAAAADREVVVVGRAIHRVINVAQELGYLDGLKPFRAEEDYGYLPPDKVVALITGSQGEPRAALARIAFDDHKHVAFSPGDSVIFSARTIPGNEKSVGAIQNALANKGVKIITDRDAMVHTSGHPRRDELRELYGLIKPKVAIPVHGEAVHLAAHAELARSLGVGQVVRAEDGKMIRLCPGPAKVVDEVFSGILVKDGTIIGSPEMTGVEERRKLGFAGVVTVTVILDGKQELITDPVAVGFGLPRVDSEGDRFEGIVSEAALGALEGIPRQRRKDTELVMEAVRRGVRNTVQRRWGKKPQCEVTVVRV